MAEPRSPRPLPNPSRRRDKPQLSCNLCRRRKLKCDRAQPCGTCFRRGLSLSCTYPHPNKNGPERVTKERHLSAGSCLTDRIGQLEQLVASLMNSAMNTSERGRTEKQGLSNASGMRTSSEVKAEMHSSCQETNRSSDTFGHISLQDSKTTYVDDTHWTAILDGISELKHSVQDNNTNNQNPSSPSYGTPELLFAGSQPATKDEILKALPPREAADRLVAEYFANKSLPLIHCPSFLRQYDKFWEHPLEAPVMWVGKLFGIFSCALLYQRLSIPDLQDTRVLAQTYSEKITQCLVLGRYQDCPPDTIETLCCSLNVQYLHSEDTHMDLLIFLGVIVRLAQRMGYHRDASHFPHISVFQGEMRRRVWALITDLDVLTSAQVGLPRMLREFQADTAPPRNLLDEDFDEDSTELPPARPNSFVTPSLYLVAKNRLISMFGNITDISTSIRRPAYAEVMRLDKLLHETYASAPEIMRERPMSKSLTDGPDVILRRIYLALLLEKAKCVLHYRYLAPARTDERYGYSRMTCIKASLHILDYHCIVHQETQPGGRLFNGRWKISILIKSEFLLATTLLCLELNHDLSNDSTAHPKKIPLTPNLTQRILQALYKSYSIWNLSRNSSSESRKAMQALDVVFKKVQTRQGAVLSDVGSNSDKIPAALMDDFGDFSTDMSSETMPPPTPQNAGAVLLDQAMSIPQFQPDEYDTPAPSSDIASELLDLSHSVDEMLGVSMSHPGIFEFPL